MQAIMNSLPPAAVVLNDTSNTAPLTAALPAQTATTPLFAMEQERKTWETGAFRTSNLALYAVLANCMAYARELPTAESKERNAELTDFYTVRGYTVKKDIPLLTRVVKAIFGAEVDRRRISTYLLVLRAAKAANVLPNDLAAWIESKGGIQEVKLQQSATFVSPSNKALAAQKTLSSMPTLATVHTPALSLLADADFTGQECVFLAEQHADGSFLIKDITHSGGVVKAALAALYGKNMKAANEIQAVTEAA
jgi:hypothetical protein